MSTMVFTRETLASLFRAAAEALQSPGQGEVENTGLKPGSDYAQALEIYINAHSKELGTLAGWLKKKYSSEPTQAKAKSLLVYAQKQIGNMRGDPQGLPSF